MIPLSATELALLAAVCEQPAEDTPRLVYADYLEEQGDPVLTSWAEYIRRAVERHHAGQVYGDLAFANRPVIRDRLGLKKEQEPWWADWDRGFPAHLCFPSVRSWERARDDGLFRRIPAMACQVKGRKPGWSAGYDEVFQDGRRASYSSHYVWGGGYVRREFILPVDVYMALPLATEGRCPFGGYPDLPSALDAAWRAFAAAGRAACRQPTAEVTKC